MIDTVRVVLHHRRLVFGTPAGLALLVVIVSLLWWRTYSVWASFFPQSTPSALAGLAGVASQFGFALPGADQSESPDFYAALITSPQVLRAVVESDYVLLADGEATRGNLVTHYKIRSGTPEEGREKAVKRLRNNISVSVGLKTGVVTFVVKDHSAPIALAIAERALALVNDFNLTSRQTQMQLSARLSRANPLRPRKNSGRPKITFRTSCSAIETTRAHRNWPFNTITPARCSYATGGLHQPDASARTIQD